MILVLTQGLRKVIAADLIQKINMMTAFVLARVGVCCFFVTHMRTLKC